MRHFLLLLHLRQLLLKFQAFQLVPLSMRILASLLEQLLQTDTPAFA